VLKARDTDGLCRLRALSGVSLGSLRDEIGDMEALLIRALGLSTNFNKMKFQGAQSWKQVKTHEVDVYLGKVNRR
jgi:hypothetical protein